MVNIMGGLVYTTSEHRFAKYRRANNLPKRGKSNGNGNRGSILGKYGFTLFCWMICFLLIMSSIIYYTTDASKVNWEKLLFNRKIPTPQVEIDNVALGMTATKVRQIHSNLSLIIDRNGMTKGSYVSNGSLYSVWFIGAGRDKKVYRIRYDNIFSNIGEAEIINGINRKYGRPASSDCRRNVSTFANECRFKWWPNGGASLYLFIATRNDKTTKVAMVATDLRLDGQRQRAMAASRATITPFGMGKKTGKGT